MKNRPGVAPLALFCLALLVVSCGGDLEVNCGAESMVQLAVNLTRNRCREMATRIRPFRDNYYRKARARQRSIRGEQSNPTPSTDARTGLAGNGLHWIIRSPAGAIVNCADHARNHALPNLVINIEFASDFRSEFGFRLRNLRNQESSAVRHSGNEGT